MQRDIEFLRNEVNSTILAIYDEDYFVSLWENVSHNGDMNKMSRVELLKPFNEFWKRLPDSYEIRRKPFLKICDLAERWLYEISNNDCLKCVSSKIGC